MDEIHQKKPTDIKTECVKIMASKDFIMEPVIFDWLKKYFEAGGMPVTVVELLSINYHAVAQTVNLLAEWLIMAGFKPDEVKNLVEDHLKDLLIKHFDPKRADRIFAKEGQHPAWLIEMLGHLKWRQLFYKLAEEYPDCLMLSLTIKLISDAGYQGEITNVATACTQLVVFSRVLISGLTNLLTSKSEEELESRLPEIAKMICHAEHTYLYSQVMISILAEEKKFRCKLRRISQEIQKYARTRGHDVTHIILAFNEASSHPRAKQSIMSMLHKNHLNPGDVTVLYQLYSSPDPPPVSLIQLPLLLELFVTVLFTTKKSKVNPDHLHKYVYLLAYAASISEKWTEDVRDSIIDDKLDATSKAINDVHHLVVSGKGQAELLSEMKELYQNIRYPVVGMGVLKWIEQIVSDSKYFEKQMDETPLHLILLDEVVSCHTLLHGDVLKLAINLFERTFADLDTLLQLELKKKVIDRMIHLMTEDCVLPVVSYIKDCTDRQDTDASLIRYFVTEVLDIISPPYSSEFVHSFLPIIENESITSSIRTGGGNDPVSDFILYCKSNFAL